MEELFLLVSLLLSKGGFSSLSSAVKVVCPFYTKECFVLGLFFCLSRDIKNIRGACGGFFVVGLGKHFSFCDEPTTHATTTNMEEITDTWRKVSEQQFGPTLSRERRNVCAWAL